MNPIVQQSLSMYRRILRNANKIVQINSGASDLSSMDELNRSRKVSELIPDVEMCEYITDTARKHFRLTQRQFLQGKLTDSDEILKRLNTAKWANVGIECALRDMTRPTHKRKNIKQSPTINILQVAIEGYGNNQVHDELLDALVVAAKFDQLHRNKPQGKQAPVVVPPPTTSSLKANSEKLSSRRSSGASAGKLALKKSMISSSTKKLKRKKLSSPSLVKKSD